MQKVQLTQSGLENLQKELDELKNVKRTHAVTRLHNARAMGDLSENSEYTAAKEDLAFIEGRVQEIEELLKNVEVVQNSSQGGKVALGNHIKVLVNNQEDELQIVGEFEADPMKKKLSAKSPIGMALLDKKAGETVEINIPAGKITYKILAVN